MTHDIIPIHKDEEARLHIAKVETDFSALTTLVYALKKHVSESEIRLVNEMASFRTHVDEQFKRRAASMVKIFSIWATIICALIASATAISTAIINANATKASIAQSKEVASQTVEKKQEESEKRVLKEALIDARQEWIEDQKAKENPPPLHKLIIKK